MGAESENSAEIGSGCMRSLSAVVDIYNKLGGIRNELSDGGLSFRITGTMQWHDSMKSMPGKPADITARRFVGAAMFEKRLL